jgi:hypothetical protein
MSKTKGFLALVLIAVMALVGLDLTIHAGEALSTNKGDLLFFNRYFTTSRTPITDLNELIGSGTAGTSGQVKVHDGTDYEPQTITASGLAAGTLSSSGALALTGTLADAKVWIGNSGGEAVAVTPSGDATITNAGVVTLAVNSVSAPQLFTNTDTITIASEQTGIDTLLPAGAILLSLDKISGWNNTVTITKSLIDTTSGSSLENYLILNTDAQSAARVVNATYMMP